MSFQQTDKLLNVGIFEYSSIQILIELVLEYLSYLSIKS